MLVGVVIRLRLRVENADRFMASYRFCIQGDARVASDVTGVTAVVGKKGYMWSEKCRYAPNLLLRYLSRLVIYGKGVSNVYSMLQYLYWKGAIVQSRIHL